MHKSHEILTFDPNLIFSFLDFYIFMIIYLCVIFFIRHFNLTGEISEQEKERGVFFYIKLFFMMSFFILVIFLITAITRWLIYK